ncbi:hypothetical protein ACFYWX_03470 [Streptomyces sp. NPDC002888]|uniref:hypothetical protein n=1 Tax=Streptomyces sp. NPDC002888 TaxID=3364668 RepID=UPI0036AF6634
MRHTTRTAAVLLGLLTTLTLPALLALLAPAATAAGQPTPTKSSEPHSGRLSPDEFYDELGVADVRTRYVVLVDTPSLKGTQLEETRTQLTTLLDAVPRQDDVTLILYDRGVRRTIPRLTRADVGSLRAPQPAPPDRRIDLLPALDAALTTLKGDLPKRAAIAVLASGEQTTTGVDPVSELRSRADSLEARTRLTVHPFPLFGAADDRARHLDTLVRVFPAAITTGSWTPWDRPDLAQVRDDVLRHAALDALARDRSGRLVVEWPKQPVRLSPKEGKATVTFTLRSTMTKVPLWISDLGFTVTDDPVPITAKLPAGKSTSGELKPGATARVTVELSWKSDEYEGERRTVRMTGRLAVHAKVTTPWEPNLTALGIRTIPQPLEATPTTVSGTGQVGVPGWVWPTLTCGAFGIAVVWAVGAVYARRRRNPKMYGWLVARYVDEGDQDTLLAQELGPIPLWGQRSLSTEQLYPSGEGTVHVSPESVERGVVRALRIVYEPYDPQAPGDDGVCPVDDKVIVNGVEFVHQVEQPSPTKTAPA